VVNYRATGRKHEQKLEASSYENGLTQFTDFDLAQAPELWRPHLHIGDVKANFRSLEKLFSKFLRICLRLSELYRLILYKY
jgi:hypothetical protein